MKPYIKKKIELQKKLNLLPVKDLEKVKKYVDSILIKEKIQNPEPKNLEGIWKNKGFENIDDLPGEIKKIRHEIYGSILKKF